MTSTKFNPRIYWTYEDTEVFEVSYQAVVDIAATNPCFAFESQIKKLEVGNYLLVAMCWSKGSYAVSMGDAIANNYDAAQDYWKMATAGNYLNYVCDERNCFVCEYEIWHVVDTPEEDKTELGAVYQEYELDALLGGFDQDFDKSKLVDILTGLDAAGVRRWKVGPNAPSIESALMFTAIDEALEAYQEGYSIGAMAAAEAMNFG